VVLSSVTTPPLIGNKTRLLRPLKGAFAKYHDGFFGRDFAPCGLLMNGLIFRIRNIALMHEAPDDAGGIAGFFGRSTGVFRCLTHEWNFLGGMTSRSFDRAPMILTY
jgi:hypothetical protein